MFAARHDATRGARFVADSGRNQENPGRIPFDQHGTSSGWGATKRHRRSVRAGGSTLLPSYRRRFPAALTLAQRALAMAASLARACGLILRLRRPAEGGTDAFFAEPFALAFAQRFFCAAIILARASGLSVRFPPRPEDTFDTDAVAPRSRLSSASSDSILSLISTARRSC
jgi:hypothetical protein